MIVIATREVPASLTKKNQVIKQGDELTVAKTYKSVGEDCYIFSNGDGAPAVFFKKAA